MRTRGDSTSGREKNAGFEWKKKNETIRFSPRTAWRERGVATASRMNADRFASTSEDVHRIARRQETTKPLDRAIRAPPRSRVSNRFFPCFASFGVFPPGFLPSSWAHSPAGRRPRVSAAGVVDAADPCDVHKED